MCGGTRYAKSLHVVANIVRLIVHVDKFVDKCVDTLTKRLMEGKTYET
jgi:hypothetical protein